MAVSNRSKPVPPLVVIAGPTGAGKSGIGLRLASRVGGEIVNYDSVQIYRGFDIGSAKPTAEERTTIPIICSTSSMPTSTFLRRTIRFGQPASSGRFVKEGGFRSSSEAPGSISGHCWLDFPKIPGRDDAIRRRIRRIWDQPGGAERLYRRLERVDSVSASRIASADRHRIERALEVYLLTGRPISTWRRPEPDMPPRFEAVRLSVDLPRPLLNETLDLRVTVMYEKGLVEETRGLLERFDPGCRPFGTIGYREAVRVLRGEISRPEAIEETRRRTRAYAKRQRTWLRSESGYERLDRSILSVEQIVEKIMSRIDESKIKDREEPA